VAESVVQVTEGSGKKLHTNSYTVGANTVEDEFTVPGEYPYATYVAYAPGISGATAAAHGLQLMAGASLKVRVRRVTVQGIAVPAAANRVEIVRLSTAGTGGGAVTNRPFDTASAAVGATAMTAPTVKGTEVAFLASLVPNQVTAVGSTAKWEWVQHPYSQAIVIPAGTANGIALKFTGLAATSYDVEIMFVETAF